MGAKEEVSTPAKRMCDKFTDLVDAPLGAQKLG